MVTTILVSEEEKKILETAQSELLHSGLSALDEKVLETLKKSNVEVQRFTRGTVVAIGAACILVSIQKKKEGGNKI
jgi:hypothetical protein